MHLRFNFDACPMHSPSGFVHLTHQNLSARALFCLNSLAKVNTQLLICNHYIAPPTISSPNLAKLQLLRHKFEQELVPETPVSRKTRSSKKLALRDRAYSAWDFSKLLTERGCDIPILKVEQDLLKNWPQVCGRAYGAWDVQSY